MLLPLSTENVRALSLENHMALAVVRSGNGDRDQVVWLLRAIYLAVYMRGETASGSDPDLYRGEEMRMLAVKHMAEGEHPVDVAASFAARGVNH